MPSAPLPHNEAERLAALHTLNLIDTPAAEVFDSFVRVASSLFRVPIAAISLIGAERQWFKAAIGLPVSETPRSEAFCAHAILEPNDVLCIPDARLDHRVSDNPHVLSGDIRFYTGVPLLDEDGHALGTLCVADHKPQTPDEWQLRNLRDLATGVSAAIRLHAVMHRLEKDARCDPLTSLGNRREFEAALAPRLDEGVTLFLLDLDGFKGINDTFGHPGGDLALKEVGRRLQAVVRSGDHAFRLGGDEFALICPGMTKKEMRDALAGRIHGAMAATFTINGQPVPLRTSIGLAAFPEHATTAEELVHLADVALYDAKRAGRGVTRQAGSPRGAAGAVASTGNPAAFSYPIQPGIGRLGLADRLRRALVPGGSEPFSLVFQPVVALSTQRTTSLEALVRWDIEAGTSIPPAEFVTLAERLGLISHLDRWVLGAACKEAAGWPEPWMVSVNISAQSFGLIDVAAMVKDALASSGLPAARLIVEMTETALAGDAVNARKAIQGIRSLGVRVSLDDFGGGHGSLTTLRQFPFTGLKIDQTLTQHVDTDCVQARMVQLLAEFGHALDVRVVAEGVETPEQLHAVARCGVSLVQGYLLSKPALPAGVVQAVRAAEMSMQSALACDMSWLLRGTPEVEQDEMTGIVLTSAPNASRASRLVSCPPLRVVSDLQER